MTETPIEDLITMVIYLDECRREKRPLNGWNELHELEKVRYYNTTNTIIDIMITKFNQRMEPLEESLKQRRAELDDMLGRVRELERQFRVCE